MKYESITEQILGCAFEVINELGSGFLESVYEKAMVIVLKEKGLSVVNQFPINVYFRNKVIGEFYADLLVENKVIVELKAVKTILPEHKAQVINYLKGTGIEVGLLINFGNQKLEYNRLYLPNSTDPNHPDNLVNSGGN
ncbi:MAG TPA: GxxExxY protein [Bacteroidales bacterium]|nr:GxxExxY protein [Candidatus Cloacimonas sp.]HRT84574.1 GxxExxY protein [Bacteroidales bacterium]